MRTVAPYVLVELDFQGHRMKNIGGVQIEIQKQYREDFNKRYSNCDRGWVVALPTADTIAGSPVNLNVGDYVFFHYHTYNKMNEVHIDGKTFYKVHFANIFFKLSEAGEVTPLNKFVFTEILKEASTMTFGGLVLFGTGEKELLNKSRVAFKPPYVEGIEVGEVVIHKENTHYDIELPDGRKYYRIREHDIIGKA